MLEKIKKEIKQGTQFISFLVLQAIGQIVIMAIPLLLAEILNTEAFGLYSYSEFVLFLGLSFFVLTPRTALVVYGNQEFPQTGGIHKTTLALMLFAAIALSATILIFILLKNQICRFTMLSSGQVIYLLLAFIGWMLKDFFATLQYCMNRRHTAAFTDLLFGLTALSLVIFLCTTERLNLKNIFISYFIAGVICCIVSFFIIDIKKIFPLQPDKKWLKDISIYALWNFLGVMSVYLINWGGLAFLRYSNSTADAAVYNISYKFFKGFVILVYMIPAYFLPHISANIDKAGTIEGLLKHKRPRIMLLGGIGIVIAYFMMPFVLKLLYAEKFLSAVPVINLLLAATVLLLYSTFYLTILTAAKAYKFLQFANISQATINIGLNFILIPQFGIIGAAWATVIAYIYLLVICEWRYQCKFKNKIPSIDSCHMIMEPLDFQV